MDWDDSDPIFRIILVSVAWRINASFPLSGAVQCGSVRLILPFPLPKVVAGSQNNHAEPLLFSVLLRRGTKPSERVPKRRSYTLPSVDCSTEPSLPWDRGIKTN